AWHPAICLLRPADSTDIEPLQRSGRWEDAGARLADEARSLEAAGAELIVLCTNTMHRIADSITAAIEVPFVHIAHATAGAVHAQHERTVGLLANAYTLEQDFYVGRLRDDHGLDVLVATAGYRGLVPSVIYTELCQGVVRED